MPLFWFLAGVLSTLAVLGLMLPWLRSGSGRRGSLWRAAALAVLVLAGALGLYRWLGHPELTQPRAAAPAPQTAPAPGAVTPQAGSMDAAIAQLEARLAKGGGSDGDWELLAKSYEFLGISSAAAQARAHHLPPPPAAAANPPTDGGTPAAAGTSVRGEVTLTAALRDKAPRGATLFIVAKSAASPGPPVAVIRRSVADWPVRFALDDSQSMVPGRNLSNAGQVTIEARISQSGQAMPSPGDLVGTSAQIDPAAGGPVGIAIDRVLP